MALALRKRFRYLYIRLIKLKGSPDYIARGVAIGFFIGFLIPIGFQMVIALFLAWIFKASKIPALACTWITNHVTVIFIYPVQCYIGAKIVGISLSFHQVEDILKDLIEKRDWASFSSLGMDIIIAFMVGGALFGIISGVISYFAAYGIIASHRNRVEVRLQKKLAVQSDWRETLAARRGDPGDKEKK